MFDNIIAKIEELLNRFGEGIVEILRGEKDIARLVKNFMFPIYNASCKVGLYY